jgi:hypothetical protein
MTSEDVEAIGRQAEENNRELGLTGFLMASGGLFYQLLEGPPEVVDQVYANILDDDRHSDVILLSSDGPLPRRAFPDWSMKTVDLDADAHVRLLPVKALMKAVYEQRRLVDNMVSVIERALQYELRDD